MDLKTAGRARFDAARPAVLDVSHRVHACLPGIGHAS